MTAVSPEQSSAAPHSIEVYRCVGDVTMRVLAGVFGKAPLHVRQMDEGRVDVAIQTGSDRDDSSFDWIDDVDRATYPELASLRPGDYTNADQVDWGDRRRDRRSKYDRTARYPAPGKAVLVYDSAALIELQDGVVDSIGKQCFDPSATHKGLLAVVMRADPAEATPTEQIRYRVGKWFAAHVWGCRHGLIIRAGRRTERV